MPDDPKRPNVSRPDDPTRLTAIPPAPMYVAPPAPGLPTRIGRYTIIRILGEGGMGRVYEAKQDSPSRTVALKVIRAGYLSDGLLRRFAQESQVLGRLHHPGIAQVFEAGTVEDERGRSVPFFAMEFIKGVPLTQYAAQHAPGTRDRLELVARICDAVYHAHQKGVIHRDLKPGNILVDDSGQPRILDFGVARATDSDIQQTTMQTDIGQLIGTVPYMSPEQVGGDPGELDTRSDVYSLGVISYELLAGRLPYEIDRKMIHEAVRVIREEEPTRLSSINRTLRGDVETIIAKALEKDKVRRYQSAESLASDIRRYLRDEPIAARPASTWYQLQKFSRRNRGLVAGIAAAFVLLVAGVVGTGLALNRALKAESDLKNQLSQTEIARQAQATQRDRAVAAEKQAKERADEVQKVSDFQGQMLAQIDPGEAGKMLAADVVAKFEQALAAVPESERAAQVRAFSGELGKVNATDAAIDLIDRTILRPSAAAIDKQFADQPIVNAALRQALANRYREIGLYEAARPPQEQALATRRRVLGEEHPDTLNSLNDMALLLQAEGKLAESVAIHTDVLEKRRRVLGENHAETLNSINNIGVVLLWQGKRVEAEPYFREALEKSRTAVGVEPQTALTYLNNLGQVLSDLGKLNEADPLLHEAVEKSSSILGPDNPQTLVAINNLGILLQSEGKMTEAEPMLREAMDKRRRVLGEEHAHTLDSIGNMGRLLQAMDKLDEAEPFLREALDKKRRIRGEEHPDTLTSINNLGVLLQSQGKFAEAETYYRDAMEKCRRVLGEQHPNTFITTINTGSILQIQGRNEEALKLLAPAEASTRKIFTGANVRWLAKLLTYLGRARAGLRDFAASEANLLEAYPIHVSTRTAAHKDTQACAQSIVDLYVAWDAAESGKGHDAQAAQWKATLEAAKPAATPAAKP